MPHHNSVFHDLTKHLPWREFEQLVERFGADHRVRRLSTKSQLLALLFGQLAGCTSLREIEAGLASHSARLYHLGATRPARSTLADANAKRPWQVFAGLFAHMVTRAGRTTRRNMRDVTRILDASTLNLPHQRAAWARFSAKHCAAKLHLVFDPDADLPMAAAITPGTVNDITPAKDLTIEPGATYVFDLAYYDYGWWAELHAQGCRFVSRLKTHSRLRDVEQRPTPQETNILSDRVGLLSKRIAKARKNPMADPVREITVRIDTGKTIRLVTNDLDAPAREIADLYKQRWQVELFFKWIKQNLKIRHFLGASQNAIAIQIFVALIAFILLRAAHALQTDVRQPTTFARLVRINIMHRRSTSNLAREPDPPKIPENQLFLELAKC